MAVGKRTESRSREKGEEKEGWEGEYSNVFSKRERQLYLISLSDETPSCVRRPSSSYSHTYANKGGREGGREDKERGTARLLTVGKNLGAEPPPEKTDEPVLSNDALHGVGVSDVLRVGLLVDLREGGREGGSEGRKE